MVISPKFETYQYVALNLNAERGDELFQILSREYKQCQNEKEKRWHYNGAIFEIKRTINKSMPYIPVYKTSISNISEEKIKPLRTLDEYLINNSSLS